MPAKKRPTPAPTSIRATYTLPLTHPEAMAVLRALATASDAAHGDPDDSDAGPRQWVAARLLGMVDGVLEE
jgi:hypothetical protein